MAQLRLSGGRFGGHRIQVPAGVRPTEGRVREALFSIWQHELPGAYLLDLFAGSGAVGLEALGRGAASVVVMESDPKTAQVLRANLEKVAPEGEWCLLRTSALAGLRSLARGAGHRFDLVFADPPYAFAEYPQLLAAVAETLAPAGQVAVEHSSRTQWQDLPGVALERGERRCYGESCLSFYAAARDSFPAGH